MKVQRGKIILLCLCLIFAMLIISGKASKLGTYLYVRCNYTHLEEFAAEVIQTGAIPDDRYKRRDVRYYCLLFSQLSKRACIVSRHSSLGQAVINFRYSSLDGASIK